jgi:hypothetical protein
VVAPGAYGIEVGQELRWEFGRERFAVELLREAGGEVLEEDDANGDGVAGCPGGGLVAEEAELDGEMCALSFHGGVYAAGVELEPAHLLGWEDGVGAVGSCADLEGALKAVVGNQLGTEDLGHITGDVAAKCVHLPEAVLSRDVALGDDEVVERSGADVGDAVGITLYGDWGREAVDGESAVELRERVEHGLLGPVVRCEEGDGCEDKKKQDETGAYFYEERNATTARGRVDECFVCCAVKKAGWFGGFGFVVTHSLI